jgi:hypothetical protein
VTVTVYTPDCPWHDRLELLDDGKVTLAGIKLQVSVGADIEAARLTVPAYPFKPPMVNVDRPCEPALTATELGLAVMEKSSTVTLTITERDSVALVPVNDPVTATVYTPA